MQQATEMSLVVDDSDLRVILKAARVQFSGLGYVDITEAEAETFPGQRSSYLRWTLTPMGSVQLALSIGQVRAPKANGTSGTG